MKISNKHVFIIAISILILILILTGCSETMPKLGLNNNQLKQCPDTPNCVCSQSTDEAHLIEPILFKGSIEEANKQILKVISTWKRSKITVKKDNYIRSEFTSKLFRFVDDVEFYITSDDKEKTVIHVRSASRIGKSDLGANRKRVELFREILMQ